jgi:hypothetical protein
MNIGPGRNLGAPLQARVPPLLEPCFDLFQIPDNAPRRKVEATRKVAALLHLGDGAVGKRHDKPKFVSPDRPGQAG